MFFPAPQCRLSRFKATREGIIETACKAEELGFDAVFVNDHIIVDGTPQVVNSWGNTYDPLIVLSYVAAHTKRIRLGTSVLIMPYRNPVATAKMMATLDQMSEGRVIAGVGAGWNAAEFAALGVPFHERGARTTEYLRLWQACWGPDPVTFQGRFFSFANMYVMPKPLQQPHPPIWIGGASPAALRRAARFGEVWQPAPMAVEALRQGNVSARGLHENRTSGRADHPHEFSGQFPRHYRKRRTQQHPGGRAAGRAGNPSASGRGHAALSARGRLRSLPNQF